MASDAELVNENGILHHLKQETNSSLAGVTRNPNLEKLISVEIKKQVEAGVFSFDELLNLGSLVQGGNGRVCLASGTKVKQELDSQEVFSDGVKNFNEIQVNNVTKETEPKLDIVPVNQQTTRKRKHRKKQATTSATEGTIRKCEKWTTEEEVALARAWVDEPEEPKIDHWKRVREKFYNAMGRGEHRNPDMIFSKWKQTRLKVEKFDGIYKKNFNNRRSGTSDLDIFHDSCDEYKTEMGYPFSHSKAWEVVRNCTKWANLPLIGQSSKRTKTSPDNKCTSQASLDDHCQNNLNDTDDEIVTREETIHPPGRNDKGKQVASSIEPDYKESLDKISSKMSKFLELMRAKQDYYDFKLLTANIDHLTGQDREVVEKMKQKVRDKYK